MADYPVTELGMLQELEGVERAIEEVDQKKSKAMRKFNKELKELSKQRDSVLDRLDKLRGGELIQFPDDAPAEEPAQIAGLIDDMDDPFDEGGEDDPILTGV